MKLNPFFWRMTLVMFTIILTVLTSSAQAFLATADVVWRENIRVIPLFQIQWYQDDLETTKVKMLGLTKQARIKHPNAVKTI